VVHYLIAPMPMFDTLARPVAVFRQRVTSTASDGRVELHELDGMAGFMVFRCEALRAEISPTTCRSNYAHARAEACVNCEIGERHHREAKPKNQSCQRHNFRSLTEACQDSSDIEDRLRRRVALQASNGKSLSSGCIRCERTSVTNKRLVGRMRLVRRSTICVSCYNREREVLRGANAKGASPVKWAALELAQIEIECDGKRKFIDIGLCSGVEEARRLVERRWPSWRVIAYSGLGRTSKSASIRVGPDR
jgi:hypothetical protein